MTSSLRHQVQDERAGRFGRKVRPSSTDEVQMGDATTTDTDGAGERWSLVDYEVDADAVAAAIVARLIAGGTLSVLEPPPRPGA